MGKAGEFRCSECGRTFSMAAHLGRHRATIHGARKSKAAAKAGRRMAVARAGRSAPGLRRTAPVASPIVHLQAYRNQLAAQRALVDEQIAAIERALAVLGVSAGAATARVVRAPRGSARRPGSLKEFVERVLRGRRGPMSVKDVTAAVLKAGYETKNKTLDTSVQIALANMPNVRRIARGQYQLRS